MAVWTCTKCGVVRESRCKPQKCQACGEKGSFVKAEAETNIATATKEN